MALSEKADNAKKRPIRTLLVTGASGLIGARLITLWLSEGKQIIALSRQAAAMRAKFPSKVRWLASLADIEDDEVIDAVINLAGESLASGRWSASVKKRLYESRIGTTQRLFDCVSRLTVKPQKLISASAVGIYGDQGSGKIDEEFKPSFAGDTVPFGHQLCESWEREAKCFESLGVDVTIVRLGVVFAREAPAFQALVRPFRFKCASYFGDGENCLSWIHIEDVLAAFQFILERSEQPSGQAETFNLTSPEAVSYKQFAEVVGSKMRCLITLPIPAPLIQIALGQMAKELLLQGQNVLPGKLLEQGFKFKFGSLDDAMDDLAN